MSRIAYVNGRYVPHGDATVSIEDRGYQFADGVYEVVAIWDRCAVDLAPHMDRLERSMNELRFATPPNRNALGIIARETVRRNRVRRGILYIQINRGTAPRNHPFPMNAAGCSVVMTARSGLGPSAQQVENGVALSVQPDIRWRRRDIKTVGLLANVLNKQHAKEQGAFEALLIDPDETVTEASAANVWIVDKEGRLKTRPVGPEILGGITRMRALKIAAQSGLEVEETSFTLDDVINAREVFLTGTTTFILPITRVDDHTIANGHPGETARTLRHAYLTYLDSLREEDSWRVA